MKKIILGIGFLLSALSAWSQGGLDSIIVERYYYSNSADSVGSDAAGGGVLHIGSSTFRVYVDMKPGFKFQALYGTQDANVPPIPLHTLLLTSTKPFYNNEDRGDKMADAISLVNTKTNTVMLDSWFSVGATATGQLGLLKTEDADGSVGNTDGLLTNSTAWMGLPIMGAGSQDGMTAGTPQPVTFVGLSTELDVFNDVSLLNDTFKTTNGSIAALNGTVGPTALNRVLIGQFTTKGKFCWELNIQIKDTVNNIIQNYVAVNPTGAEMTHASLKGCDSTGIYTHVDKQQPAGPAISLYPNPVQDVFTMEINASELNNASSYTIYNVLGNSVLHKELGIVTSKLTVKINMSGYPAGLYVMEVSSKNGVSSHRQIIKK